MLHRYGTDLPDYRHLADYQPPTVTRIHAADGRLMAEYAHEKRIFVPIEAIPKRLIQAFLSAEDKNFYRHPGVDPLGILRAVLTNLRHLSDDRRPVGASTITQQVAKNFLLEQRGQPAAQDQGGDPRLPHRAGLQQGPDPRALPQPDLPRRRLLWGRGGGAELLRQVARRADDRRGGVPRRAAQGAVLVSSGAPARGRQGAPRLGDRPDARRRLHQRGRMPTLAAAEPLVDAAPRADRDRDRGVFHRGGAARAGRGAWRGLPVPGRPVDPHHDGAGAPGAWPIVRCATG